MSNTYRWKYNWDACRLVNDLMWWKNSNPHFTVLFYSKQVSLAIEGPQKKRFVLFPSNSVTLDFDINNSSNVRFFKRGLNMSCFVILHLSLKQRNNDLYGYAPEQEPLPLGYYNLLAMIFSFRTISSVYSHSDLSDLYWANNSPVYMCNFPFEIFFPLRKITSFVKGLSLILRENLPSTPWLDCEPDALSQGYQLDENVWRI